MSRIHEARLKLRGEIEAPPGLRRFGSGWISGVLGLVLGVGGLLLVISLRAPGLLAMPETRGLQGNHWFRLGLHLLLLAAFILSALSLALRHGKVLGATGVAATLLATLLGGSRTTALVPDPTPLFFGLLDRIFGTYFFPPERWPGGYGIPGHPVPRGYVAQFKYPFSGESTAAPPATQNVGKPA